MIVVPEGSRLLLVTQPDHAHLAGELLALWRADGLPDHPRRAELLFAAREHDNGWREADAAPRVDPGSGRPFPFTDLPRRDRIEIWRRGVHRFADDRPYATLLIAEHASNLLGGHREDDAWRPFFDELEELRDGLLEDLALDPDELAADYRFVALTDLLSLAACNRWSRRYDRYGVSCGVDEDGALAIDPFPLAGATTFRVPCRWIPDRSYAGEADLGGELAAARWRRLEVRVVPWAAARQEPPEPGRRDTDSE